MANSPLPSPLIKPDEPISGIRLSDWLRRKAHDGTARADVGDTKRRVLDEITSNVNRRLPRPRTSCLRARKLRSRSMTYWSTLRHALPREP